MRRLLISLRSLLVKYRNRGKLEVCGKACLHPSSKFDGGNRVGNGVELYHCYLGYGSYVSSNSYLQYLKTGKFCSLGKNIQCIYGRHPSKVFVSTHPAFYSPSNTPLSFAKEQFFQDHFKVLEDEYSIIIGNDVWIGDNVLIFEGIRIGDGAIIAAGAVVTKDVDPYAIVGGVPAKLIRKRFTQDQIDFLRAFKWWNKPESWIKSNVEDFTNIEVFMQKHRKEEF